MKQQLAALAVDAATMVARGQHEVFDLLADRAYELFGADGGVGFCRCLTDDAGAPEIRLHVGGVPPMGAPWMERAKELAPRTPSIVAFRTVGDRDPLRVSDIIELPGFWGTEEFAHLHGVHGGRYPMGAAFVYRPDELAFIGLHRIKRDFDDDDVADLGHLQRILAQAFAFRRSLDDAVRDMTLQTPRRAPALSWLAMMTEEYLPTRREAEVLALVVDGWTNQQIASRLGITERTVRKHLSAVYERAGLAGRAAAAGWWRSRGLHQA
jgi:DNA-binding CsgD family transcriptional regulator